MVAGGALFEALATAVSSLVAFKTYALVPCFFAVYATFLVSLGATYFYSIILHLFFSSSHN